MDEKYPFCKIPLLSQVLEMIKPTKLVLNIELKTSVFHYEGIEQKVVDMVKEYGLEDRIIYYLLSPTNKSPEELRWVHTIWKLLMYNDIDALNKPLPKYSDVIKLI